MSVYIVPQGSMLLMHTLKKQESQRKAEERRERQEFERHMIRELIFRDGRVEVSLNKNTWLRKQQVTK